MWSTRALVTSTRAVRQSIVITSTRSYASTSPATERSTSTTSSPQSSPLPWHLTSAVILERVVKLTPEMNPMEKKMLETFTVLTFSVKSIYWPLKQVHSIFDHNNIYEHRYGYQ